MLFQYKFSKQDACIGLSISSFKIHCDIRLQPVNSVKLKLDYVHVIKLPQINLMRESNQCLTAKLIAPDN
jgi:hypothetical protein